MPRFVYFVPAILLLLALPLAAQNTSQTTLRPESRVLILRGLTAEFATARKALPKGLEGLHLNTDGQLQEQDLEKQLANNGPAVRPGELVQITKIGFRSDHIVFDINGGGRKKRKWYQRIEVGTGSTTRPVSNEQGETPTGSNISLHFNRPLPDMTVDQLKQYLAPVLDFSQRSASLIITESWPKEIQDAVKNHEIKAGMTREMVLASLGHPENKIREKKGRVEQETWVYGKVPSKILLVVFENDEVVEATQYIPGVPASKVPRMDDPPAETPPPNAPPPPQ